MPDSGSISIRINGATISVVRGTSVAAAALSAGVTRFRRSVTGESRAPLCGMGICFECRVKIDGRGHEKSCQIFCADGMDVRTDE
jgi:predicted molibdopterin-dependent oxidoreductase YjgC